MLLRGVARTAGPPAAPLTKCPVGAVVSGAGYMDNEAQSDVS
jgi:hypothetical protein